MWGQLARLCTGIAAGAIPTVIGKLTVRADERMAHLESRHRVNLNVRAPKRSSPRDPPIARDIVGARRPFPLARFLDEKEREDPAWRGARRSFAPTFGTVVQVLKKKKLREDGAQPIYVEQNHRAQLFYTEGDRQMMEEAWELTAAHREDLAGLPGREVPADRRSVLDMLRSGHAG